MTVAPLLARNGILVVELGKDQAEPVAAIFAAAGLAPMAAHPEAVAEVGLERLPHGPVHNWGFEDDSAAFALLSAADRRKRVLAVEASSAKVFGKS